RYLLEVVHIPLMIDISSRAISPNMLLPATPSNMI
ncbi:hypothetical protein AC249_AIPGENE11693, partial [Exaiptasia diaphana]